MAVLTTYRRVLAKPGAVAFSLAGLTGRLPISMVGLGIVLLVEDVSGSYGIAGTVTGAYTVANAILAIVQGRLLDRLGQARVLTVACLVFAVALSLLVVAVRADWHPVATYVLAAVAGGSLPQVGSCVRARWSHVLDDPRDVQTAFALEGVFDETVFIVGPILVALLATTVDPVLGLGVAVVACVVGSLSLAGQRTTAPPTHQHDHTAGARPRMPWRTVAPLAVVSLGLGVLFGAAEVTTVAFAEEHDAKSLSGALLALWALGSLVAGVITGAISWRRGPSLRVRVGALAMATAMVPLYFVDSVALLGLLLLLGGFSIAPTLIATISLTEQVVPRVRMTEGLAIMQTGLVAGVAPGAALSGFVVDHAGASPAYLVSAGAGLLAALAALALPRADS
jgi:MFS family permease